MTWYNGACGEKEKVIQKAGELFGLKDEL